MICVLVAAPVHSSNEFVWKSTYNSTGMNSMFYVCLIGLLTSLFSFSGYEAGAHMAEETTNASKSAPLGIIYTCLATAVTGFVYILGLLYSSRDISHILNGVDAPQDDGNGVEAIVNVFTVAFTNADDTKTNLPGALAMTSLLIINIFFAGFSSLTVTSRIGFAMCRDGALPGSRYLYKVN